MKHAAVVHYKWNANPVSNKQKKKSYWNDEKTSFMMYVGCIKRRETEKKIFLVACLTLNGGSYFSYTSKHYWGTTFFTTLFASVCVCKIVCRDWPRIYGIVLCFYFFINAFFLPRKFSCVFFSSILLEAFVRRKPQIVAKNSWRYSEINLKVVVDWIILSMHNMFVLHKAKLNLNFKSFLSFFGGRKNML